MSLASPIVRLKCDNSMILWWIHLIPGFHRDASEQNRDEQKIENDRIAERDAENVEEEV